MSRARRIVALALAGTLAGMLAAARPALAQKVVQERGRMGPLRPFASPGAVIGADSARDSAARLKGQAAADRGAAAEGAIVFVPDRRPARDWFKGAEAGTGAVIRHQPADVWVSCDASYAVTRGTWRPDGATAAAGVYATVWQRQPKSGEYRWILDLRRPAQVSADVLDMIAGNVAPCPGGGQGARSPAATPAAPSPPPSKKPRLLQPDIDPAAGGADDGSLRWRATLDTGGAGSFVATVGTGAAMREVVRLTLPPAG